MITTKIYLHANKDSNYDIGEDLGFSGDILRNFSYTLSEVEFEIKIDEKTGKSKILKVNGKTLNDN